MIYTLYMKGDIWSCMSQYIFRYCDLSVSCASFITLLANFDIITLILFGNTIKFHLEYIIGIHYTEWDRWRFICISKYKLHKTVNRRITKG